MEKSRFQKVKRILCVLAAALILASLSGCGSKAGGGKDVAIDMDKLAAALEKDVPFKDEMSRVDNGVFYGLYGLAEEDADKAVLISSTGATAEEIAVIHAASPDKVSAVNEAVRSRIEAQREGFENYVPGELEKLKDPVVEQLGDYVILCVSDDNDKAEEIISQFKKDE